MCNAYNHPPGCNCGWGQGYHGATKTGTLHNSLSPRLQDKITGHNIAAYQGEVKTCLTSCPWCGVDVYYHTNGKGDSVYFDNLGYPWPVHECFKRYWNKQQGGNQKHLDWFDYLHSDEQKRIILQSIIRHSPYFIANASYVYQITEEELAIKMGISILHLQKFYGHLYEKKGVHNPKKYKNCRTKKRRRKSFYVHRNDLRIHLQGIVLLSKHELVCKQRKKQIRQPRIQPKPEIIQVIKKQK